LKSPKFPGISGREFSVGLGPVVIQSLQLIEADRLSGRRIRALIVFASAEVFNLFYTADPTDIPSSGGGPP